MEEVLGTKSTWLIDFSAIGLYRERSRRHDSLTGTLDI